MIVTYHFLFSFVGNLDPSLHSCREGQSLHGFRSGLQDARGPRVLPISLSMLSYRFGSKPYLRDSFFFCYDWHMHVYPVRVVLAPGQLKWKSAVGTCFSLVAGFNPPPEIEGDNSNA